MAQVSNPKIQRAITIVMLIVLFALSPARVQSQDGRPIADAGLSRYAATDPVQLDGTGSYDPDDSGPLSYTWRQIAGPSVEATDTDTATPTISGFIQTDEIQECEFELIVSNGEYDSLPDTVRVVVVPYFGESNLRLENKSFDPKKPTTIYFGGGDCTIGHSGQYISDPESRVNIIDFPYGYTPDSGGGARTYYKYGDMIIAYLSSVAPDYKQPIQSAGFSTGGQPGIDVGIRLNQTYRDARYAVNRVTFNDATPFCRNYSASISTFLGSSVDGEQCWVDNYVGTKMSFHPGVLNVALSLPHVGFMAWYGNSLTGNDMNQFNNGVVAGTYWSVMGPGKNLQLASTPDAQTYKFRWYGDASSGYMDFFDESSYPGRLPEPVTLLAYSDALNPNDEPTGALLTCKESVNAVGYQLLFGPDPYRVMDYNIISDTPTPPAEIITTFPFEETWWTIRAYDQYGSTIYADPIRANLENLLLMPPIDNLTNGRRYGNIQLAINDANPGDEIVVGPGVYQEDICFRCKNLTLRSTDPNDSAIVATTIIEGYASKSVVTFSGGEDAGCILDGLTITGGTVGISCSDASPMIRNCTIESTPISIEFLYGYEPTLIDCTILGSIMEVYGSDYVAYWKLDETEGDTAIDSVANCDGTLNGGPVWQAGEGIVDGALQFDGIDDYVSTEFVLNPVDGTFSVFAWIKGVAPGQVIISQLDGNGTGETWVCADTSNGNLMTGLVPQKIGRYYPQPLISESIISDGQWHHIGFVWDSSYRTLYADGIEVAKDNAAQNPLKSATGGLYIGAGKNLNEGTFFSGLLDDVCIYNKALNEEEIAALAQ